MRTEARVAACALAAGIAALVLGCAGGSERALRIGVLTDCVGIFRTLEDAELSGAQLPLIERGARPRQSRPEGGITSVSVAGRPVELIPACTETGELATMFEAVRRLVEHDGVDAVLGGAYGADGVGLRKIAARYPEVAFVSAPSGPREVTLRDRAPNLFRVAPDHEQTVAGLATYAYRELGWRRAAVVAEDWDAGWGWTAAFVREFCSLGGAVVDQERLILVDPTGADAKRVPADVDGVAVLTGVLGGSASGLLRRLAARFDDPARALVLGPAVIGDEASLRPVAGRLDGVVGTSRLPLAGAAATEAHVRSYHAAFPDLQAELARRELVIWYRSATEALLRALEQAGGDLSDGGARLREELGRLDATFVGQPVRIDGNGQAIVTTPIVRVGSNGDGGIELRVVRTVRTDQSIGGLVPATYAPGARDEPCTKAPPPPWAR